MALDYPSNPTVGQTFQNYVWNGTAWAGIGSANNLGVQVGGILSREYNPNYVINGAFDIWQRGITFATANWKHTADRFAVYTAGATTVQRTTTTPMGVGTYSLNIAASTNVTVTQSIEFPAVGVGGVFADASKTFTFSLYAKTTSTNQSMTMDIVPADTYAGGNQPAGFGTFTKTITPTWTRYSVTFTGGTINGTNACLRLNFYGAPSEPIFTTGWQLEEGSAATPFRRNANSIAGELAACQRYYYRVNASSTDTNYYRPTTGVASSTTGQFLFNFPVTMRIAPYSIDSSAIGTWKIFQNNSTYTGTSLLSLGQNGLNASTVSMNATGQTSGQFCILEAAASQAGYVGFSAEL